MRGVILTLIILALNASAANAQDRAWIQIAARPSLGQALDELRKRNRTLDGVKGFRMRSGWYAVILGPFTGAVAVAERDRLVAQRRIPADSFVAGRGDFRRQFWPIGQSSLSRNAPYAARQSGSLVVPAREAEPEPETEIEASPPETTVAETGSGADPTAEELATDATAPARQETRAQARASERLLDQAAREDLQRALAWAGHYGTAIDGDFGPGTRRAMANWQAEMGYAATGVLTTGQRAEALSVYRSEIAALGLRSVTDPEAGITIDMPTSVVARANVSAPFVHYVGIDAGPTRVLLISQAGGRARLNALYEVMQTLAIVPAGARARLYRRSFTIEGTADRVTTFAEVRLAGDTVKGFVVVWPDTAPGDAAQIVRAIATSFAVIEGQVLGDDAGDLRSQHIDLVAGLALRRPVDTRSGFFVDAAGRVLTAGGGLDDCARVTLGAETPARIEALPNHPELALLTPEAPLAPRHWARFRGAPGLLSSEIVVAGFAYGGRLGAPTLTYGKLADIRGLSGEEGLDRLALRAPAEVAGGPVLDGQGAVLGLLRPVPASDAQRLPGEVRFSTDSLAILDALKAAGHVPAVLETGEKQPPAYIEYLAREITVLVSCWD